MACEFCNNAMNEDVETLEGFDIISEIKPEVKFPTESTHIGKAKCSSCSQEVSFKFSPVVEEYSIKLE